MYLKKLFNRSRFMKLAPEGEPGSGGANPQNNGSNEGQANISIDYDKLAEVVNKRSSATADSVLKGQLKDLGLSGEDLNKAVADFKNKKASEEQAKQEQAQKMADENKTLRQQLLNMNISSKLSELASGEGIDPSKVPFLEKLIDKAKLVKEDGTLAADDDFKKEIGEVLKAFPDFKMGQNKSGNGFQQIGSNGSQGSSGASVNEQLDAIFGIKKK